MIATWAAGGVATMTSALPLVLSIVAMILALPVFIPVTMPTLDTVATVGSEVLQVGVCPLITAPFASRASAVAFVCTPIMIWPEARVTRIVPIGFGFVVGASGEHATNARMALHPMARHRWNCR